MKYFQNGAYHKLFTLSLLSFFVVPVLTYIFISIAPDEYTKADNFYKIQITEGMESAKKYTPFNSPIVNLETTKDWLSLSLIDVMSYDASNYDSRERYDKFKEVFSSDYYKGFWKAEGQRIEENIEKGYLRNTTIISKKPILLGEAKNIDGYNLWQFYIEMNVKIESMFLSKPIYATKKVKVIVKETNPNEKLKGLSIARIDIK